MHGSAVSPGAPAHSEPVATGSIRARSSRPPKPTISWSPTERLLPLSCCWPSAPPNTATPWARSSPTRWALQNGGWCLCRSYAHRIQLTPSPSQAWSCRSCVSACFARSVATQENWCGGEEPRSLYWGARCRQSPATVRCRSFTSLSRRTPSQCLCSTIRGDLHLREVRRSHWRGRTALRYPLLFLSHADWRTSRVCSHLRRSRPATHSSLVCPWTTVLAPWSDWPPATNSWRLLVFRCRGERQSRKWGCCCSPCHFSATWPMLHRLPRCWAGKIRHSCVRRSETVLDPTGRRGGQEDVRAQMLRISWSSSADCQQPLLRTPPPWWPLSRIGASPKCPCRSLCTTLAVSDCFLPFS